jgi:hypothetical protein
MIATLSSKARKALVSDGALGAPAEEWAPRNTAPQIVDPVTGITFSIRVDRFYSENQYDGGDSYSENYTLVANAVGGAPPFWMPIYIGQITDDVIRHRCDAMADALTRIHKIDVAVEEGII